MDSNRAAIKCIAAALFPVLHLTDFIWASYNSCRSRCIFIECGIISESSQSACYRDSSWGSLYWTAGQRTCIDPTTGSTFVWRVTSSDTYSDTVSLMTYTNWKSGEPNNYLNREACMQLASGYSYAWNDDLCSDKFCSVCELDIWVCGASE